MRFGHDLPVGGFHMYNWIQISSETPLLLDVYSNLQELRSHCKACHFSKCTDPFLRLPGSIPKPSALSRVKNWKLIAQFEARDRGYWLRFCNNIRQSLNPGYLSWNVVFPYDGGSSRAVGRGLHEVIENL